MSKALFSNPPPAPAATEPPVWIRRLALIRAIEPELDVIREIPFELGLNLILTRQPLPDSTESLGHDVGKTLLTRLIRYLLGEAKYADGRTRAAIRHALPDSLVAGEFRVGGRDWAVMRPLGAPSAFAPRAGQVLAWRNLLAVEGSEDQYSTFLRNVGDAVLENVTSPSLTHARRPIAWLDVLAWIARDQKCRYSHPLVWRHTDTDSGTPVLHAEDASTVLRCVSGLMDAREKLLFEKHDELLQKRQERAEEVDRLKAAIAGDEAVLQQDLKDLLGSGDVAITELELELIRTKTKGLEGVRDDEVNKLGIPDLRETRDAAVKALADVTAEEKSLVTQVQAVTKHIKKAQERPRTIYESFADLCDKPVDDCPVKLKIAKQQLPGPDQEALAELHDELAGHQRRQAELAASKPKLEGNLARRKSELEAVEKKLPNATQGIDSRIALYADIGRRVERHIRNTKNLADAVKDHSALTIQIDQSSEIQRQHRDAITATRAWLSDRFSALCKDFVGGNRPFELEIESKAIRLKIVGTAGAPGEATSTSALVLSLDLAAMQSAVEGYGQHPRVMILDSPREADMEIGIFNRMIRRIAAWHQASPKPLFQMIMTTTTRPEETDIPPNVIRIELARVPIDQLLLCAEL
jgi:predicted  nucleic acid-binding Zn-ribbon protein